MPPSGPTGRIEAFKKKDKDNGKCAVCAGFVTTVLMQHHSFVCSRCSGLLRECGLTVKGITMTNWTSADADKICNGGNQKEREELCGGWDGRELAVTPDSSDRDVKKFIQAKYVDKKWARGGGGGGGGGGRGGASSSSGGTSPSAGSKGPSPGDATKLANMFPDLNEAKAAELLRQHGSIEEAVEKYLTSGPPEPPPPPKPKPERDHGKSHSHSSKDSKKKDSKRKSSKHHSEEDSQSMVASFSNPDVAPPSLGDAPPERVGGMAGMVGMLARGEINAPYPGGGGQWGAPSSTAASASFGGGLQGTQGFGAGQFSSVPGNFGSDQQPWQGQQQGGWGGGWGDAGAMPSANAFQSAPGNVGHTAPGNMSGSQKPWSTQTPQTSPPQNAWQAPATQAASHPQQSCQAGQGWNQQQSSAEQERLQQLLKLRARKQEILRQLQQQQAAATASSQLPPGSMGGPAGFHGQMGAGGGTPHFGTGGQAQNGFGTQAPQSGFGQAPAPCPQTAFGGGFGGSQSAQMYPQNAW